MKECTLEFYPDGTETGKPVLRLSLRVLNQKRFNTMTDSEQQEALQFIEKFEERLHAFKERLKPKEAVNG